MAFLDDYLALANSNPSGAPALNGPADDKSGEDALAALIARFRQSQTPSIGAAPGPNTAPAMYNSSSAKTQEEGNANNPPATAQNQVLHDVGRAVDRASNIPRQAMDDLGLKSQPGSNNFQEFPPGNLPPSSDPNVAKAKIQLGVAMLNDKSQTGNNAPPKDPFLASFLPPSVPMTGDTKTPAPDPAAVKQLEAQYATKPDPDSKYEFKNSAAAKAYEAIFGKGGGDKTAAGPSSSDPTYQDPAGGSPQYTPPSGKDTTYQDPAGAPPDEKNMISRLFARLIGTPDDPNSVAASVGAGDSTPASSGKAPPTAEAALPPAPTPKDALAGQSYDAFQRMAFHSTNDKLPPSPATLGKVLPARSDEGGGGGAGATKGKGLVGHSLSADQSNDTNGALASALLQFALTTLLRPSYGAGDALYHGVSDAANTATNYEAQQIARHQQAQNDETQRLNNAKTQSETAYNYAKSKVVGTGKKGDEFDPLGIGKANSELNQGGKKSWMDSLDPDLAIRAEAELKEAAKPADITSNDQRPPGERTADVIKRFAAEQAQRGASTGGAAGMRQKFDNGTVALADLPAGTIARARTNPNVRKQLRAAMANNPTALADFNKQVGSTN